MSEVTKTIPQQNVFKQLILALPVSLMIFITVAILLLVGFEVAYANRVYPGVYVYNMNLTGLTIDETNQNLAEVLSYTYEGNLQLTYQNQVWDARPIDLGYRIDPNTSAERAFDVGRGGLFPSNLIEKGRAWFNGVQLSPVVFYDERIAMGYLQDIAEEIDRPLVEASLRLENTEVIVVTGQVGRTVDIPATLSLLSAQLAQMQNATIPLVVSETPPVIMDVTAQAEQARRILSEPLVLTAANAEGETSSWSISPDDLAAMLTITRVGEDDVDDLTYQIALDENAVSPYLSSLAPGLSVEPVNARFIFNDDTEFLEVIEPAVIGRQMDVQGSIEHINEQINAGAHNVNLQFETIDPPVTDQMTGEDLGITEQVYAYTSYYFDSASARVQNIRAASARFHGLLVAPGETFSMAQALGNISLDNGYAEALIIYGGQTIQGVGGGVCQVSTTLFRAAFFAGFPIVERYAHSYRVGYYELRSNGTRDTSLAGLDATVYVPIVDMKFTNDTDHWLLMETYPTNTGLTWKFYSTKDGRTVDWSTTGLTNVKPSPEPLYRENPELSEGTIKQVDYAADGADVNITRTVYKNDQVYFSDSFFTRYQPWQAVYEYGPGTEGIPESGSD